MDYHMQFLEFLSLLQKRGLSYAMYEVSFSSPKTWTIICNFSNFFLFSKYMDYHMQFMKFLYLLQIRGLSYAIYEISFSSTIRGLSYASGILILLQKRGLSY